MIEILKGSKVKRHPSVPFKDAVEVVDAQGNSLGQAQAYQQITWREPGMDKDKTAFVLLMTHKDPEWTRMQNWMFALGLLQVEVQLGGVKEFQRKGSTVKGQSVLTADDVRKMAKTGTIMAPADPRAYTIGK